MKIQTPSTFIFPFQLQIDTDSAFNQKIEVLRERPSFTQKSAGLKEMRLSPELR